MLSIVVIAQQLLSCFVLICVSYLRAHDEQLKKEMNEVHLKV